MLPKALLRPAARPAPADADSVFYPRPLCPAFVGARRLWTASPPSSAPLTATRRMTGCRLPGRPAACLCLQKASFLALALTSRRMPMCLPPSATQLELAQHLAGATLHAWPKGATDAQRIAVGETLRRLVAKCLCSHVKSEAGDWLSPLQVGVAVPLGAEAAIHSSRHWVHANHHDPDKVFLKLDFVNAFNTIDRAALRDRHHTRLLFQGDALSSEAGVQQGDPLGPLLSCTSVPRWVGL